MDSMDELFIPYKSSLELPISNVQPSLPSAEIAPSSSSSNSLWIWLGVAVLFVIFLGAGLYFALLKSSLLKQQSQPYELFSAAPESTLEVKQVIPSVIPNTIEFNTPTKLNTETMGKEELAKFIGTEIKNLLVLYSGVNSLQTASIVGFSVRTMLEDFNPVLQPKSLALEKIEEPEPLKDAKSKGTEKFEDDFISTKVLQPRPQHSHINLDADEEDMEKDPPKKGKINADTDTNLLMMLKQRGLLPQ